MSEFNSPEIARLLKQQVNFLSAETATSPVIISSRIRLARNLKGFPFPGAADPTVRQEVADSAAAAIRRSRALGRGSMSFNIAELSVLEREILLERHLASRSLLEGEAGQMLHISANEALAVMVNEEDHLRMQAILPGSQLRKAWKMVNALDDKLSGQLDIAYDSKLGFLTSCLSNVGTGIRISQMLHLPALTIDGSIKQLERGLPKLGLTMRGMFGEGSENLGFFYQISNQSTLGESEMAIMEHLEQVIGQVVDHEENARLKLLEQNRTRLLDKVGRSFAALRYSYILPSKEAFAALSGVRLGVDLKMFHALDSKLLNDLLIAANSGHLQYNAGRLLSEAERDAYRAQVMREALKKNYDREL